jgi:hypothetical protein
MPPRPLWKCPKCGVKLVSRNLSHACGDFSVSRFLEGKGKTERALFRRFVAAIAACGPYEVAPAKTRVAFLVRVRFASVNRAGNGSIDVHLVLLREIESARIRRVERVGKCYVHHLRLSSAADFDDELSAGSPRRTRSTASESGFARGRVRSSRHE